jgi:hypothetical protein
MAENAPHYRERVETPEYQAQFDMLLERYSAEMIENCLLGVLWGISTKPEVYPRLMGTMRKAKSEPYSSDIPSFTIMFNPEPDGTVLMCWIEEAGDGLMEHLT